MTIYDDFAQRMHRLAAEHAQRVAPPPMRFTVKGTSPLTLEQIDGELVLHEGDPDVEIERRLIEEAPSVGDQVYVHTDAGGDYIVGGVLNEGG